MPERVLTLSGTRMKTVAEVVANLLIQERLIPRERTLIGPVYKGKSPLLYVDGNGKKHFNKRVRPDGYMIQDGNSPYISLCPEFGYVEGAENGFKVSFPDNRVSSEVAERIYKRVESGLR